LDDLVPADRRASRMVDGARHQACLKKKKGRDLSNTRASPSNPFMGCEDLQPKSIHTEGLSLYDSTRNRFWKSARRLVIQTAAVFFPPPANTTILEVSSRCPSLRGWERSHPGCHPSSHKLKANFKARCVTSLYALSISFVKSSGSRQN
jgi:hypothetical protein